MSPRRNIVYRIPFIIFSTFYSQFFKQIHLIIIMPYMYLSYKQIIKVSHIITYTLKKYENTDTNICLQLGLIIFSKLESSGICVISFGCPGCISINHIWAIGGIEKSNIYQYFKILYGLKKLFGGGGSSEDMIFGYSNCMFEFSILVHIMWLINDKYMGLLSAELIISLIYMCNILCGLVNTYEFLVA